MAPNAIPPTAKKAAMPAKMAAMLRITGFTVAIVASSTAIARLDR
jgi:hypothetical protein